MFIVMAGALAYLLSRASGRPRREIANALSTDSAAGFNVVVITLDTTRADHLGCYGYSAATTPVLDRLATGGVRFADAVSCVPMTLPAHCAIFTGLNPPHHGVRDNGEFRLDAPQTTLAEILQEQGYDTAAFVSAFVLDSRYGLDQGFNYYDDQVDTTRGAQFGTTESQRSAKAVTDAAIKWLRTRPADKPAFLWTHYYDPHDPYQPPAPYAAAFAASPYDGEIAFMDTQLGRLVGALDEAGMHERTLMIVVGDHGESLGEHHEGTHGRSIYEATQHVPLILWCPSLFAGPYIVDDAVVGIVDVFPTVLDLLGIDYAGPCDGVPLRLARQQPDRAVYIETMMTYLDNGWAPLHGLRRHLDKYVSAPIPEYYDLTTDPHELNNLFPPTGAPPARCNELTAALDELMKGEPTPAQIAAGAMGIDREAMERLHALGYVTGPGWTDGPELPDPKKMMPDREVFLEAKAASKGGRFGLAVTKLKRVLEHAPDDPSVLRELGMTYLQMNQLDKAEAVFKRHIELKPQADIYMFLAQIAMRRHQFALADSLLDLGRALEPDHGALLVTIGDLAAMQGRPEKAMEWYERARKLDPYRATGLVEQRIAILRNRQDQGG